jgi:hypothetical protein
MSIKNFLRSAAAMVAVSLAASSVHAAVFDQPSTSSLTNRISGNAPSGLSWEAVATGTALPIRSSGTQNGAAGAVAYWNVNNGQLQIDPKGWNISLFNFTYTTGTVNTSGSTAGPLVYASGTTPTTATVSGATGLANQRTMPAGTWTLITCAPARIAGTVSLTRSPTLATSYDNGNGAGGTSPYATNPLGEAVTPGWMTQPWAFPADMVTSGSVASMQVSDWKVFGVSGNANAGLLGYAGYAYQGLFQYTVDGVVGNQVGAVIPVNVVPEPSTMIFAGVGIAAAAGLDYRRRQRRKQAPALTHEV